MNAHSDGAGHLVVRAQRETYTGTDGVKRAWTSARLDTLGKWSFVTGTLSARIKVPSGAGLWPAFWLLGTNIGSVNWPACGEIDVMETVDDAGTLYQTIHGPVSTTSYQQASSASSAPGTTLADRYHVYSVARTANSIAFSVDGKTTRRLTPASLSAGQAWVFDKPMFLLLNLAVGGDWPGPPDSTTPDVADMLVDWIRFHP